MLRLKEILYLIKNKIKYNKPVQIKILIISIPILVYYLFLNDIDNSNIKIETLKVKNKMNVAYSVSLENNMLKINEYSENMLDKKYCKKIDKYHKLRLVISLEPIIVECNPMGEAYKIIITDNQKSYELDYTMQRSFVNTDSFEKGDFTFKDNSVEILAESQLTFSEIEQKYCNKQGLNLKAIISNNPMTVACSQSNDIKGNYVVSDKWYYSKILVKHMIVGQTEQYLLRHDYSKVDKFTGEVIENSIVNNSEKKYRKGVRTGSSATLSKNGRFFTAVTGSTDSSGLVVEVNKDGEKTKIIEFATGFFFKSPYVEAMASSDNGNYLYMFVSKDMRGSHDLYMYIVNVETKSIVLRKKLIWKTPTARSFYILNKIDHMLMIYDESSVRGYVNAFKIKFKTE